MAVISRRHQFIKAVQVFAVEDKFAHRHALKGLHPRPIGPLRFFLLGQMVDGVRQNFHQPLQLLTRQNSSGYHLFFGKVKHADGIEHRLFVASQLSARYVMRVEGRYYQPLELDDIVIPMGMPLQATSIELAPGYGYPFPTREAKGIYALTLLRGNVVDQKEKGIADTKIQVEGMPDLVYRTDKSGQWVLIFPDELFPKAVVGKPTLEVQLRVTWPDGTTQLITTTIDKGVDTSLSPLVFVNL